MVTRNINANTATQVNANLIGVLVHPNTYPPIVTVDDIVVDYQYATLTVQSSVPVEVGEVTVYSAAITAYNSGSGDIFYFTSESKVVDGQTYYRWDSYPGNTTWNSPLWTLSNTPSINDPFYVYTEDPESMVQATNVQSVFNINTNFIKENETEYSNTNYSGRYTIVEISYPDQNTKIFLVDPSGNKVGWVSTIHINKDDDKTFVKGSVVGDYQSWTNGDYVSSGFGVRTIYTITDSPAVGDQAMYTADHPEYDSQEITAIDTTETPVDPDPVKCTVSYSTDGETFTEHPTVLTDDNNVICNIPRYVYLKFSQDVEITEE